MRPQEWAERVMALLNEAQLDGCNVFCHWSECLVFQNHDRSEEVAIGVESRAWKPEEDLP